MGYLNNFISINLNSENSNTHILIQQHIQLNTQY